MTIRLMFALLLCAALSACSDSNSPASSTPDATTPDTAARIQPGRYRMVMNLQGHEAPVMMELGRDLSDVVFINGSERVRPEVTTVENGTLTAEFTAFNNELTLNAADRGLEGTLKLVKRGGKIQEIPVHARRNVPYRFPTLQTHTANFTGRWAVTFVAEDGIETPAIGEFDQLRDEVTGTFLTPVGDYRFLAGNVSGNTMKLSTFDGAHAFLFDAEMQPDGSLRGNFWSGTEWHETWTARKDFDAELPDAFEATSLTVAEDEVDFTFPNLDGEPVSLSDPRYEGKVVLVTLAGTWCPNCADEAEFLVPYYRNNQDRGLEVIGLLFEHFADFETAAERGMAWKNRHDIDFELLIAGTSDKSDATETVPFLDRVRAFPTMIMIGRDGTVRDIHTGFNGPGTGKYFEEFKAEFNAKMDRLLAEEA